MDLDRLEAYLPREGERERFREEAEEFHGTLFPPESWSDMDKFWAAVYFACNAAEEGSAPRDEIKEIYEDLDTDRAMRKQIHGADGVKKIDVKDEEHLKLTADGLRKCRELFSGDNDAD